MRGATRCNGPVTQMQRTGVTLWHVPLQLEWFEIYRRLKHDRDDEQAWLALQRRVARQLPGMDHWVEDVVAETCAGVAVSFDRARGPDTFQGFVLGQMLNARRRSMRALGGAAEVLGDYDVAVEGSDEQVAEPSPQALEILRSGIAALPWRERRALSMRYFDNASTAQIAHELQVTEVNARRLVFNALRRLRQTIRPRLERARDAELEPAGR